MPNVTDSHRAEIDALVARFFSAFDNRDGRSPDRDGLCAMFCRGAVVVHHGGTEPIVCSAKQFAAPRVQLLAGGRLVDFHEWEQSAETFVFGTLAARRSLYSKSGRLDGAPYAGTGTKLFQFALFGEGWRITALSWIDDAPAALRAKPDLPIARTTSGSD